MNKSYLLLMLTVLGVALVCGCQSPKGETVQDQRTDVMQSSRETLTEFKRVKPGLSAQLEKAAGYGVFNNFSAKLMLAGTGTGYGVVHDNRTGKDTYMRMAEVNVGLGFGIKKFRVMFVFNEAEAMRKFVEEGMEFGANASVVAKAEGEGGGITAGAAANPVDIYQLTDTGVALSATVAGTKYWKDEELNSAVGSTVPKNVKMRQKIQSAIE